MTFAQPPPSPTHPQCCTERHAVLSKQNAPPTPPTTPLAPTDPHPRCTQRCCVSVPSICLYFPRGGGTQCRWLSTRKCPPHHCPHTHAQSREDNEYQRRSSRAVCRRVDLLLEHVSGITRRAGYSCRYSSASPWTFPRMVLAANSHLSDTRQAGQRLCASTSRKVTGCVER